MTPLGVAILILATGIIASVATVAFLIFLIVTVIKETFNG